jgi:histidinol-phosphate aminotransferase
MNYIYLLVDGVTVNVPRKPAPDFGVDVKSVKEAVFKNNAKILILTSPNNPDGSVISHEEIEELLDLPCLLVLDEAYIEFYGVEHSFAEEVPKRQNLIVLRTFSKRAALAGTEKFINLKSASISSFACNRFTGWIWYLPAPSYGIFVADETTIQCFCCCRNSCMCCFIKPSLPRGLYKICVRCISTNSESNQDVKNALVSERENMFKMMSSFSFLEPYKSKSNFILCR